MVYDDRRYCHTDIWAWEGNKMGNWIKLMSIPSMSELPSGIVYLSPVFLMKNGELLFKAIRELPGLKPRSRNNTLGNILFVYNQMHKTYRELKIPCAQLLSREEMTYAKSLVSPAGDAGDDHERLDIYSHLPLA
ncbi:hypothetical protein Q3G72_035531 [Acer saccharum]|nr:hypothetical protein Q3G72_035531 [Acer saccharum]